MRLLKRDDHEGFLHLQLDSLDDLWTLRTLIQTGDRVVADTVRTAPSAGDKLREAKMEKRRVRLGVRAESVEWHEFDDHLRVLGPIEAGFQDTGQHHTLMLRGDGMDVQIQKRSPIRSWHSRLIAQAIASTHAPQVLLLAIDDSEAQFANLKSYGLQLLGSLPSGGQGKRHPGADEAKRAFYEEAMRSLKMFRTGDIPLAVVGPGWWREEFLEYVTRREPSLVKGVVTEGTSQGGRTGLQEALKRGLLSRMAQDHRVGTETALIEEVMTRIAKDNGTVAYGKAEVERAIAAGATQGVLVTDRLVREGDTDAMLRAAEVARADVHVISTGHEAGARLQQMGGLAALLRFALPS